MCDQEFRVLFFKSRVVWLKTQNLFPGLTGFFGIGEFKFKGEIA